MIVDGGTPALNDIAGDPSLAGLRIRYQRCLPPSASRQRNLGLSLVDRHTPWIGFLDDDCGPGPGRHGPDG